MAPLIPSDQSGALNDINISQGQFRTQMSELITAVVTLQTQVSQLQTQVTALQQQVGTP